MLAVVAATARALEAHAPLLPDLNARLHPSDSTPWTFATSGTNSVFQALNHLIADYAGGASVQTAVNDTQSLNSALNFVSQQRVTLDNSLTRLSAATDAVTGEKLQLTTAQANLMQADLPQISTQLSLAETQQTALEDVMSQLGSGSLFDKIS